MRITLPLPLLPFLLLVAPAVSSQAVPTMASVTGVLLFDGHGTLGDFTGKTSDLTGALVGAATLEGVRGWVSTKAATLNTGNGRRDKDMRSSLEVEKFPLLRFDLEGVGVGPTDGDSVRVTLRGHFTIHGVRRESAVQGWATLSPARITFRGTAPMTLTDYDIGGLSKAFGLLKMNPDIVVRMELVFSEPRAENREQQ